MELALVLVLAELRVVLLCLPWVPTLAKGRVGPFVLGIFVPPHLGRRRVPSGPG